MLYHLCIRVCHDLMPFRFGMCSISNGFCRCKRRLDYLLFRIFSICILIVRIFIICILRFSCISISYDVLKNYHPIYPVNIVQRLAIFVKTYLIRINIYFFSHYEGQVLKYLIDIVVGTIY
jgi:hypothetical protein